MSTAPSITSTSTFTAAARVLAQRAREVDLVAPGFRSPPRIVGVDRTIRRARDGEGGVVSVRLGDRPFTAVVADMIEGVIVINRLSPPEADRARTLLWRVMLQFTMSFSTRRQSGASAEPTTRVA
jgi:hypothetical protein